MPAEGKNARFWGYPVPIVGKISGRMLYDAALRLDEDQHKHPIVVRLNHDTPALILSVVKLGVGEEGYSLDLNVDLSKSLEDDEINLISQ